MKSTDNSTSRDSNPPVAHRSFIETSVTRNTAADTSAASAAAGTTALSATEILPELYRQMSIARAIDREAVNLQRTGVLPAYAPLIGQEAAQVGSGAAIDKRYDFAFPTYRELGVAVAMGVDLTGYMATHLASWHGGLYDPVASRFAPIQAVVAGSVLHAMGWALGQKLDAGLAPVGRAPNESSAHDSSNPDANEPAATEPDTSSAPIGAAIAYFGDGASSQGDVHEAMNFAGVYTLPVVFFCQNNGWAISVPTENQVAGGSVSARAAGYGLPSEKIDGNDVAAVYEATTRALNRAHSGGGATVIEAMTYRVGPHSTSDDPGRYRSLDEEQSWRARDPLKLCEKRLRDEGLADEFFTEAAAHALEVSEQVRTGILSQVDRPMHELFDFVYAEPPAALLAQRDRALEEIS